MIDPIREGILSVEGAADDIEEDFSGDEKAENEVIVIHTCLYEPAACFTKNLKSDCNHKHISGAKTRFTKNNNIMITSVFERN